MRSNDYYTFKAGAAYATSEEIEERKAREAEDAEDAEDVRREHCVLEYQASSSGQEIEIWVWSAENISVKVNGRGYDFCEFASIPAGQREAAASAGVVVKLGPIGLTAERKAIIDAAIRKL